MPSRFVNVIREQMKQTMAKAPNKQTKLKYFVNEIAGTSRVCVTISVTEQFFLDKNEKYAEQNRFEERKKVVADSCSKTFSEISELCTKFKRFLKGK